MRKRQQIVIELTSLLDVILIMLFVILIQARGQTALAMTASEEDHERTVALEYEVEALHQTMASMEADQNLLREESESWKRRVLTQDVVLDNSLVITISVRDDYSILFESEKDASMCIPYSWANDNYARNALSSKIRELLQEDTAAVFLVLQYDRNSIYWREYEMLQDVFREAKTQAQDRELPLSILDLDIIMD